MRRTVGALFPVCLVVAWPPDPGPRTFRPDQAPPPPRLAAGRTRTGAGDWIDPNRRRGSGNFNGNGNVGSFNGNGNSGSFNGNGNRSSGRGNGSARDGSGNGTGPTGD